MTAWCQEIKGGIFSMEDAVDKSLVLGVINLLNT